MLVGVMYQVIRDARPLLFLAQASNGIRFLRSILLPYLFSMIDPVAGVLRCFTWFQVLIGLSFAAVALIMVFITFPMYPFIVWSSR